MPLSSADPKLSRSELEAADSKVEVLPLDPLNLPREGKTMALESNKSDPLDLEFWPSDLPESENNSSLDSYVMAIPSSFTKIFTSALEEADSDVEVLPIPNENSNQNQTKNNDTNPRPMHVAGPPNDSESETKESATRRNGPTAKHVLFHINSNSEYDDMMTAIKTLQNQLSVLTTMIAKKDETIKDLRAEKEICLSKLNHTDTTAPFIKEVIDVDGTNFTIAEILSELTRSQRKATNNQDRGLVMLHSVMQQQRITNPMPIMKEIQDSLKQEQLASKKQFDFISELRSGQDQNNEEFHRLANQVEKASDEIKESITKLNNNLVDIETNQTRTMLNLERYDERQFALIQQHSFKLEKISAIQDQHQEMLKELVSYLPMMNSNNTELAEMIYELTNATKESQMVEANHTELLQNLANKYESMLVLNQILEEVRRIRSRGEGFVANQTSTLSRIESRQNIEITEQKQYRDRVIDILASMLVKNKKDVFSMMHALDGLNQTTNKIDENSFKRFDMMLKMIQEQYFGQENRFALTEALILKYLKQLVNNAQHINKTTTTLENRSIEFEKTMWTFFELLWDVKQQTVSIKSKWSDLFTMTGQIDERTREMIELYHKLKEFIGKLIKPDTYYQKDAQVPEWLRNDTDIPAVMPDHEDENISNYWNTVHQMLKDITHEQKTHVNTTSSQYRMIMQILQSNLMTMQKLSTMNAQELRLLQNLPLSPSSFNSSSKCPMVPGYPAVYPPVFYPPIYPQYPPQQASEYPNQPPADGKLKPSPHLRNNELTLFN